MNSSSQYYFVIVALMWNKDFFFSLWMDLIILMAILPASPYKTSNNKTKEGRNYCIILGESPPSRTNQKQNKKLKKHIY